MVVIAIDYGEKKIGLAVGNTETMTSSPISIIKKAKTGFNWDELKEKIMEWEPNRIIIGKPLNMDGTRSCLLYTSPSPRDTVTSRMPSSA